MRHAAPLPRVALAATIGLLSLLSACGSDTTTESGGASSTTATSAPATSAPTTALTTAPTTAPTTATSEAVPPGEVPIRDYEFVPPTITVAAGETVTWRNGDDVDHWVLTDDLTTVDSGAIESGQAFTATLTVPGQYPYYCDIHNAMTGTIVVE